MRFFGKRFDTPAYRECDQASSPAPSKKILDHLGFERVVLYRRGDDDQRIK